MTTERSNSYGRVMKTLSDMGPSKLHPAEQDRVREAADTLFFTEDETVAAWALDYIRRLADVLVESGRWLRDSAERLISHVEGCGPLLVTA